MSTFITNSKEKVLKKRIQDIISKSEELKFLVGFFYFSGIKELYETLKTLYHENKLRTEHVKILVGLEVDKDAYGIYEVAKTRKSLNDNQLIQDFLESLKTALTSEELDNEKAYEQIDFFISLLEEKKLVIRKTRKPNHAKLYLFKMNEMVKEILPHLFITGSSNLTKAGLESQYEFNVEIKDYGFEEAEKYFDKLWEESIELSENDVKNICLTLRKETFIKKINPFTAYVYLLKTYLDLHRGKGFTKDIINLLKERGYKTYTYQIEAVSQALANCETHGGTIIADVVGLGKTIIACLTAKAIGKRGLVICPPHLIGDEDKKSGWKKYLADFKLWDWEVRSLGKIEEALEFVKDNEDIEVIIVDEAHRFRNERTESYHYLREICRGKTVILLTATPFNNRPSDIFALMKLFTIPKKSTIILDENLENRFTEYEILFNKLAYIKNYWNSPDKKRKKRAKAYYEEIFGEKEVRIDLVKRRVEKLAKEIRAIIEPVVIRRNRLDLKYYPEEIDLPEVKDPIRWFFELTPEQLDFYDKVIQKFAPLDEGGEFTGAIYFPIKYEKGLSLDDSENIQFNGEDSFLYTYQRNLYDFMRRLLVKRFESSFGAFRKSIMRFAEVQQKALDFINKTGKFVLNRKLIRDIPLDDLDKVSEILAEYEKYLMEEKIDPKYQKIYEISKFKDAKKFIDDIQKDLELFRFLGRDFEEVGLSKVDPKACKLVEGIKRFLKEGRKVVIFTEYLDTAIYLDDILKNEFGESVLPAYGDLSRSTIEAIYENFDAQYKNPKNDYQILLTTDKLSEGFNLNRAGVVINYDIPWNPVRVIQRVGRINRIGGKVHDEIYIVNFFPTEKGADIVRSEEIAKTKMFMIHNVLGEDAKIFTPDEEPKPSELYLRLNKYTEDKEESFFTKIKKEYDNISSQHPEIMQEITKIPNRVKVAKFGQEDELMVFIRKGKDLFVGYKKYSERQPVASTFEEVYEKIKAYPETQNIPLSKEFWTNYRMILDKSSYFRRTQIRSNEISIKAFNMLKSILEKNSNRIKPHEKFISDLAEDIKSYGTLSEYILSEIVEWEKILDDEEKLEREISRLKEEIGEDFLERTKKNLGETSEEIIIAIENQTGEKQDAKHNTKAC